MDRMHFFLRIIRVMCTVGVLGTVGFGHARACTPRHTEHWTLLFNGTNLDGWIQRGGKAEYRVEEGAIVGRTVPKSPNSFLCTRDTYRDFVLELEFQVHPRMNSGVQFRSECFDTPREISYQGKTIKIEAGRVHGYQYEIDPSSRKWTGGVYDEGRRGWLFDLKQKPLAQEAFRQNVWNRLRIEARGNHIRTWINDLSAADFEDSMTHSGFIALQVHSVADDAEPMEIRWRNIRLKRL